MSILARWSGECPECGERWQPGDLIRSDRTAPDHLPIWQHAVCPDVPDDSAVKPTEEVCPRCFLIVPKGRCDCT